MNGVSIYTIPKSFLTTLLLLQLQASTVLSFGPSLPSFLPPLAISSNYARVVANTIDRHHHNSRRNNDNAAALSQSTNDSEELLPAKVDFSTVGFVLLAGGSGSRMKANMPKQFLTLRGSPVLHYSLDLFLEKIPEYAESQGLRGPPIVVLVLDPIYQPDYQPIVDKYKGRLAFADPGVERQGSVENGLSKVIELTSACTHVAIHDSARPLVTIPEIRSVVADAQTHGAAVLGVPCKATIKESEDGETVLRTIPRARLWEVHTPQVVEIEKLRRGFGKVREEGLEVTDDVSVVEALGEVVKLTLGEYTNLKITTPEDMDVANAILEERGGDAIDLLG